MNIAAYCRVSTDKEDQLNSLETQKEFFLEYTKRTGDNLIKLYADEGISGTKIKNRKEFQRMLADAEKGLFDMVVVKDISRFARNTIDSIKYNITIKDSIIVKLKYEYETKIIEVNNMSDSASVELFKNLCTDDSLYGRDK